MRYFDFAFIVSWNAIYRSDVKFIMFHAGTFLAIIPHKPICFSRVHILAVIIYVYAGTSILVVWVEKSNQWYVYASVPE